MNVTTTTEVLLAGKDEGGERVEIELKLSSGSDVALLSMYTRERVVRCTVEVADLREALKNIV